MKILLKILKILGIAVAAVLLLVLLAYLCLLGKGGDYTAEDGSYTHIDGRNSFAHICDHPGLEGLGEDVLPWEGSLLYRVAKPLKLKLLIPFLGKHEATVVDGINYTIDCYENGTAEFLSYYTADDIAAEESKADTGLVFYHTAEGAPSVIVCPGGSFEFIGVASSGYPYVETLQNAGYNVFILEYRVGLREGEEDRTPSVDRASEDMIAAVSYILDNAETLGISSEEYMVLGSSAGGQLTVRYCAEKVYAQYGIPEPSGCIMLYPANCQKYDYEGCTTPMYITVCEDDPMIDVPGLDTAVEAMEVAGVPVSYNKFETGGHSFGMGVGTLAEGWLDRALLWMAEQ